MILEFYDDLGRPRRLPAKRVMIFDDLGNPHAVAIQVENFILTETLDNPAVFHQMLRNFGLHHTVIVRDAEQVPLGDVPFRG
jgi:hypothetical protein